MAEGDVRFADTGDGVVAYRVRGEGEAMMIALHGWGTSILGNELLPSVNRANSFIASGCRLVELDWRSTGLSDPVPLEEVGRVDRQLEDLCAVLTDLGTTEPVMLFASHSGTHAALRFAVENPERVRLLSILNGAARFRAYEDGLGFDEASVQFQIELVSSTWGTGQCVTAMAPRLVQHEVTLAARYERAVCSRAVATAWLRAAYDVDSRPLLGRVSVPTTVVQTNDIPVPDGLVTEVAAGVAGAEVHRFDNDAVYWSDAEAEFIAARVHGGDLGVGEPDITTILFTDVVGSTHRASADGDTSWRRSLDDLDQVVGAKLADHGGRLVKHTGDGHLIEVRTPTQAIELAVQLVAAARHLGTPIRVGIHFGEVHRRDDDVAGLAVHIAARIAALAGENEVLTSRTVRELATAARRSFDPRGARQLKGVDEPWELFAVVSPGSGQLE